MRSFFAHLSILLVTVSFLATARQEIFVQQKASAEAFNAPIGRAAVSTVSGLLAVVTDKSLKIFDAKALTERAALPAIASSVTSVVFSPNGESFITGSVDGSIAIWNVSDGTLVKTIATGTSGLFGVRVMGQSHLLVAGMDRSLKLIDATTGKTVNSLARLAEDLLGFSLHPAGQITAVAFPSGQIQLISLPNLNVVRSLAEPGFTASVLRFSDNGKLLIAGGLDGTARVWSTDTWTVKDKLGLRGSSITSIALDPEEKWIVTTSLDSTLRIFDAATKSVRKSMRASKGSFSSAFFLDRENLLTASSAGEIIRWQVLESPPDTVSPVISILEPHADFAEANPRIYGREIALRAVVSDESGLKEVTVNGKAATLQNVDSKDSLQLPTGKFAKKFRMLVSLDSVGANRIEVKGTDEFGNVATTVLEVERLTADRAIEVQTPENNSETEKIFAPLEFKVWFEAASYEVLVNLLQMVDSHNIAKLKVGATISEDIPLVAGYNQIQIVVTGKSGEKITKTIGLTRKVLGPVTVAGKKAPPTDRGIGPQRWAVVVGISEYAHAGIPGLKFADRDAEAFAAFLKKPQGGGFDRDHIRVLLNKDATLPNVRDALINFLSHAIDKDLVMIYFAGHGAPDPARPSNLYLLTHDSDPNVLGTTAFPMWQIQDVLARYISAKRIVVLSDACHSGGISMEFATRGVDLTESNPINQYLADLARSKEGIVVFTASAAGEVSQELPEFNHGVFTYYLLRGMEGEADLNNDYTVTINELMQYVEEQVKRKTRGAQNPTRSQTSYDKDLPISLIAH